VGSYSPRPTVDLIVTPGPYRSRVFITVSAGLLGGVSWVPTGHLVIDVVASDLVGLTPADAALKCLRGTVEALERVAQYQQSRSDSAAPQGGPRGGLVNVALPGLEV